MSHNIAETMMDDIQLLREYRESGSEKAFGELVARYLDLVYSAAFRIVGQDHQLAEDVSQSVFVALAQKSRELPANVILGGWLYRHTFFVAAQTVRTERRRRAREEQAAYMNAPSHTSDQDWETLAPFLEEAMHQLDSRDRDAIVLRFFQGRDLRSVGVALGSSDDAARMRITRALDKLKNHFEQRGVRVSSTILASLLGANAVTAAPSGLAATITTSAVTAGTAAGTAAAAGSFVKGIIMNKLTIGILGTATVAGLAVSLTTQHQLTQAKEENTRLRGEIQQLQSLGTENEQLKARVISPDELARLRKQESELLRLRGENGLMRDQAKKRSLLPKTTTSPSAAEPLMGTSIQKSKIQTKLGISDTLLTGGMETSPGKRAYVFIAPHAEANDSSRLTFDSIIIEAPDAVWKNHGLTLKTKDQTEETVLNEQDAQSFLKSLQENSEASILSRPRVNTSDGVEAFIHVGSETGGNNLTMSYHMSPDHNSLDLSLITEFIQNEVVTEAK